MDYNKCEYCKETSMVRYFEMYDIYMCDKCANKESVRPVVINKPTPGEVIYDHRERPVCHICGKGYRKLCSHAYNTHNITADKYKQKFGLEKKKGITSTITKAILQDSVKKNYDVVVVENLLNSGKESRFKIGCKGRTKDKVSLQTYKKLCTKMAIINEGRAKNGKK
ncbi:MAG: MucR family transcriptional regulator [Clostridia bacterium]|uniref:MucR family transcriptional regulator n=1 Tax=Clostridium sp. TaxID=1506 RepID=UPI002FCA74B9